MKQYFIFALICLLAFTGCANGADSKKKVAEGNSRLTPLINDFKPKEGFDVINVGGLGAAFAKAIMKRAAKGDEDLRLVSNIAEGIYKLVVIEFEDASEPDKSLFRGRVDDILENSELLMEAKGDGDMVSIYGVISDDMSSVSDFIFYVPSDDVLICMFGSVSVDVVGDLFERHN